MVSVGGGATARIRGHLGGGHSRNIGLCYKGFKGSQDPLLRVGGGARRGVDSSHATWTRVTIFMT